MSFSLSMLTPVLPEILLAGMACLVLVVDAFLPDTRRGWSWFLAQASLVIAFVVLLRVAGEGSLLAFDGQFVLDRLAVLLKAGVLVLGFVAFSYTRPWLQERGLFRGEYFVLGLFALLGMMILISAGSLLVLYLGLELMSLSLYAMVAFMRNDGRASEAAMKYFVLGAIASGMLLYGMSILYGVTGSLDLMEINRILLRAGDVDVAVLFGMAFIVAGIAFKLGAVPFHMWIPDVYEGAPT
ncbi:MAG: NADH:ubiquinone oxidoreductase subunit N, partial [Gammaproteobacteria bacterium]